VPVVPVSTTPEAQPAGDQHAHSHLLQLNDRTSLRNAYQSPSDHLNVSPISEQLNQSGKQRFPLGKTNPVHSIQSRLKELSVEK
ncbi:hypothetical protein OGATHE_004906, partial [Ogataea polymorpha]